MLMGSASPGNLKNFKEPKPHATPDDALDRRRHARRRPRPAPPRPTTPSTGAAAPDDALDRRRRARRRPRPPPPPRPRARRQIYSDMLLRHGRLAASYAAGAGLKSGCHGILLRKAAVTKENAIVSQWARADKVGCRVALWWRRSWGSMSGRATGLWWRRSYGGRVGRAQQ